MSTDELNEELSQMYGPEGENKILSADTLQAPISELKLKDPVSVSPETPVSEAIKKMTDRHIGCLMVTRDQKLVGIFTERDVLTRVAAVSSGQDLTVEKVMTHDPSTLTSDHMIAYALNFMHVGGFRHVPIVDPSGKPVGLVGVRDVLKYLAAYFPAEVRNLPPHTQSDQMPRDGG